MKLLFIFQLMVVGSGHSPSDIACTDGFMMSLRRFCNVLHVEANGLVTTEAGITLEKLNEV
jgi:FAD/FMN-containing dehydrogenase